MWAGYQTLGQTFWKLKSISNSWWWITLSALLLWGLQAPYPSLQGLPLWVSVSSPCCSHLGWSLMDSAPSSSNYSSLVVHSWSVLPLSTESETVNQSTSSSSPWGHPWPSWSFQQHLQPCLRMLPSCAQQHFSPGICEEMMSVWGDGCACYPH